MRTEDLFSNVDEYEKFVTDVFCYYNGKINVINPAELIFNYAEMRSSAVVAKTECPNIVTFNITLMWMHEQTIEGFKSYAIFTIIHELFHCDQYIEGWRLSMDPNYVKFIEDNCDSMTCRYMLCNKAEIFNVFGIDLNNPECNYVERVVWPMVYRDHMYERVNYDTHILKILQSYCKVADDIKQDIVNALHNLPDVAVVANQDNCLIIKHHRIYTPIMMINEFFKNLYYCDIAIQFYMNYCIFDTICIISIDINRANIMCTIPTKIEEK